MLDDLIALNVPFWVIRLQEPNPEHPDHPFHISIGHVPDGRYFQAYSNDPIADIPEAIRRFKEGPLPLERWGQGDGA